MKFQTLLLLLFFTSGSLFAQEEGLKVKSKDTRGSLIAKGERIKAEYKPDNTCTDCIVSMQFRAEAFSKLYEHGVTSDHYLKNSNSWNYRLVRRKTASPKNQANSLSADDIKRARYLAQLGQINEYANTDYVFGDIPLELFTGAINKISGRNFDLQNSRNWQIHTNNNWGPVDF